MSSKSSLRQQFRAEDGRAPLQSGTRRWCNGGHNGGHLGKDFVGGSRTWSFKDQLKLAEWLFQTYRVREQHLCDFPDTPISTAKAAMMTGVPSEYIDPVVVMIESGLIDLLALAERFKVQAKPVD